LYFYIVPWYLFHFTNLITKHFAINCIYSPATADLCARTLWSSLVHACYWHSSSNCWYLGFIGISQSKRKKWLISHWQLYVLRRIDYICALVGIWLNNILNFVNTYSGWCWQLASLDFLLLREARLRFGSNFNFLHFQLGRQTGLPQQPNDFDCGYYTLKYMDNPSIVADQSYQVYAFFFNLEHWWFWYLVHDQCFLQTIYQSICLMILYLD